MAEKKSSLEKLAKVSARSAAETVRGTNLKLIADCHALGMDPEVVASWLDVTARLSSLANQLAIRDAIGSYMSIRAGLDKAVRRKVAG